MPVALDYPSSKCWGWDLNPGRLAPTVCSRLPVVAAGWLEACVQEMGSPGLYL